MIYLNEAMKMLQNTYLDLVNRNLGKTKKRIEANVICCKCKRGDKTLLKRENEYICKDCLKELEEEDK